jgi:hypothetical protein
VRKNKSIAQPRNRGRLNLTSFKNAAASKHRANCDNESKKQRACRQAVREAQSFAHRVWAEAAQVGPEASLATRVSVLRLFALTKQLHDQIDEAFSGHAFLPDLGPTSMVNRCRFNSYFELHRSATRLLLKALRILGIDTWDDPLGTVPMQKGADKSRANATQGVLKH